MSDIKKELFNLCVAYVKNRIETSLTALEASKEASEEETKSSAGDKYETGRAMMQQETDRHQLQLNESNKLMDALARLTEGTSTTAEAGSLVITNNGNFYLSISAGLLTVDGKSYFAVSPASPVGLLLRGKAAGYEFHLNGKTYIIESVI